MRRARLHHWPYDVDVGKLAWAAIDEIPNENRDSLQMARFKIGCEDPPPVSVAP